MEETKRLAQFVVDLQYDDFSDEVVAKAKYLMLDQIGCQIAFAKMPVSKIVYKYIRDRKAGKEESTIVYYGLRTNIEDTAFANAVFGHGFEMDDTELRTTSHPGVAVIPAALATGEAEIISGKELLTAIVAGYEVMLRAGMAARKMINRSFHTTSALGTFGAAAAAAKIMGFDIEKMISALGIAGSESGGITEYAVSGGTVKRLHAGFAAQSGVKAALLSQAGLTGPSTVLEGKKGFCQAFSDEYDVNEITADLGNRFQILWTGTKPYCCCAAQHTSIDAASEIMKKRMVSADEIESITIVQRPREARTVGNIIEPQDIVSAQFSGRFGVAMRLIKGSNGFKDYSMINVRDAKILSVAKKIAYVEQPFKDVTSSSAPSRVIIKMKDGSSYEEQVEFAKGTVQNPMSEAEITDKFRELVCPVLQENKVEKIIQTITNLETIDDIWELSSLLANG
jgi:2-methylcitrate dehydratase PrpD